MIFLKCFSETTFLALREKKETKNVWNMRSYPVILCSFFITPLNNDAYKLLTCGFINSVLKCHFGILPKAFAFSNREVLVTPVKGKNSLWHKQESLYSTMTSLDEAF